MEHLHVLLAVHLHASMPEIKHSPIFNISGFSCSIVFSPGTFTVSKCRGNATHLTSVLVCLRSSVEVSEVVSQGVL